MPVIVADKQCVTVPVSDATEGDALGVDPAGAQTGPMLRVGRCVPAIDSSGDADATDGEPVADGRPVAICETGRGREGAALGGGRKRKSTHRG